MEQTNVKRTDIPFDNVSYREVNRCSENRTYAVGCEGPKVYRNDQPTTLAFALCADGEA